MMFEYDDDRMGPSLHVAQTLMNLMLIPNIGRELGTTRVLIIDGYSEIGAQIRSNYSVFDLYKAFD